MDKTKAQVLGDKEIYELNPEVKKYSLMDAGFRETKQGSFRMQHPINGGSPYANRYDLKATVGKGLDSLKLSITDKSGMHDLNIFKVKDTEQEIEDFRYLMKFLMEKNIIVKK